MEITYGGLPQNRDEARALLERCREIGVTSFETYISWAETEPARGAFAWKKYDEEVALLAEYGIRWVPFIIIGSWYLMPDWFKASDEHLPYRCLEHGRENGVDSLWNPALPEHIKRYMNAFAAHYLPMDVIESVLLGITGDYGEAIYPAVGNWPLDYHTHPGYWCGDERAVSGFQGWLHGQFGSIQALNAAWGTNYAQWNEVAPFLPHDAPSDRARLDFMRWYRGAMTDWADLWMGMAVEAFPETPVYLCTGGDGSPAHGSDFSAQCKVAAKHGGGVRITNEGSDYVFNLTITRLVASAGRHYGAFFGFEPASRVDAVGAVARIYNAVASGARQLHDYVPNTWREGAPLPDAAAAFDANRHHLIEREPIVDVAVLLPLDDFALKDVGFTHRMTESLRLLRQFADFDFVDEGMIRDGALKHYKFLLHLDGSILARDVQQIISDWVARGGVTASWQLWQDVGGNTEISAELFGLTEESDHLTGIQGVKLLEPEFSRILSTVPHLITVFSFTRLAPSTVRIAATERSETDVIWLNRHGDGIAVFYAGPKELDPDLSFAWMGAQHMYIRLLEDVLYHLPALLIGAPALERVEGVGNGVYVTKLKSQGWLCLNLTAENRSLFYKDKSIQVDPHSINIIG